MKNFKGFFLLFFFFCHQVYAEQIPTFSEYRKSKKEQSISPKKDQKIYQHLINVSLDRINGRADEFVFHGSKKLSELNWDIKNLKMLSIGFNSKIPDLFGVKNDIFEARIKFSNAINGGNGGMIDYDWLGSGYDGNVNHANWTDRSLSDVKIQKAQQFDIAGSLNLYNNELRFNLGYKKDRFKWRDYGRSYIYSSGVNAFRDDVGNLNGERGINYEQIFNTPYIGIEYRKVLFDKNILAKIFTNYSSFVSARDEDYHLMRNIKFNEYFSNGKYYNWGTSVSGKIKENIYLGFEYEQVYYPLNRGDAIITDLDTNQVYRNNDSAGIRNKFSKISVNLKYSFTTTSTL